MSTADISRPFVQPKFVPQEQVGHVVDSSARGIITAFMIRGKNHSYEVQWAIEKSSWHLDFELVRAPDQPEPIGFWAGSEAP